MKYTPQNIAKPKDGKQQFFSIPIYQRLFEWKTENIKTLLEDLWQAYKNKEQDYYIGMLTATDETNELVDGQQRFTVMMLMGCVLQKYDERWAGFLFHNRLRLHFASRPLDENILLQLIHPDRDFHTIESNMSRGVSFIRNFMQKLNETERSAFATYVFEHLSFFISRLPKDYKPQDLNRYFERMNSSGKNLEHHEILKVKLLSKLAGNISNYMVLWNKIADVDTLLINKKDGEKEEDYKARKEQLFFADVETATSLLNGHTVEHETNDVISIRSIPPSPKAPNAVARTDREYRCALRFPQLLLQTLYWMRKGQIKGNIEDFFNTHKLLDTFSANLPYEGTEVNEQELRIFFQELLRCRLVMDICFIRPTDYGYGLDMNLPEEDESKKKLLMLESMLFVSSSNNTNYRWFSWLMESVTMRYNKLPTVDELYDSLKNYDDVEHEKIPELSDLSYGNDMRYWFWRLDFYIWLNRNQIFGDKPDLLKVADKYVFIRNRSLEHIAPQKPMSNSNMIWEDTDEDKAIRDSFGNLVMISQGLNSSLQNESYEVKRAHVEAYCSGSKTGSIESLKLLVIYKKTEWNKETIIEHGKEMYQWLENSYKKS